MDAIQYVASVSSVVSEVTESSRLLTYKDTVQLLIIETWRSAHVFRGSAIAMIITTILLLIHNLKVLRPVNGATIRPTRSIFGSKNVRIVSSGSSNRMQDLCCRQENRRIQYLALIFRSQYASDHYSIDLDLIWRGTGTCEFQCRRSRDDFLAYRSLGDFVRFDFKAWSFNDSGRK